MMKCCGSVIGMLFLLFLLIASTTTGKQEQPTSAADAVTSIIADNDDDRDDASTTIIQAQVDWIRHLGGTISDRIEIRRIVEDEHDQQSTPGFGIFAKEDIAMDETLFVIPREAILDEGEFRNDDEEQQRSGTSSSSISCATVWNLMKQLRLGSESKYAPYIAYLQTYYMNSSDEVVRPTIPSGWSTAGQELLLRLVVPNELDETDDLPPSEPITWLAEYDETCGSSTSSTTRKKSKDPLEDQAALVFLQKGWDTVMIPIYDMLRHRNGENKWYNTYEIHSIDESNEDVTLKAKRAISAGEELYTSYNLCKDCGSNRKSGYGTPEIFRDYGFVESYPQRWFFGKRLKFEVDEVPVVDDDDTSQDDDGKDETATAPAATKLQLTWLDKTIPSKKSLRRLALQLERLNEFQMYELESADDDIPLHELELVRQFHNATVTAMELALASSGYKSHCDHHHEGDERQADVCVISRRYDDLSFHPDDLHYSGASTCDDTVSLSFDGFIDLETVESHYQLMLYSEHAHTGDLCFFINGILQICESYRPHYHEMVVHYTARFLPEIKRVLWVGGGDSMLLHEILKYPTLEFVVGLEIDQVVTRMAFKHFGMQPHFDDPKVQWWYGDASKSLLMLPKSYFGSFDMVLVDLSETVTSKLVTKGLDVLQALTLLLKPEGILVKNEVYLEEMAAIASYTLQINVPHVCIPYICDQCLVFGSRKTDFLYQPLTEHERNAQTDFIQPLSETTSTNPYELWHDYRKNTTSAMQHMCNASSSQYIDGQESEGEEEASGIDQKNSPGILMIMEVEGINDAAVDLQDSKAVLAVICSRLEDVGLSTISTANFETSASDDDDALNGFGSVTILSILLQEGYVVIRAYPRHQYCAIDFHLWSRFDLQEAAKIAMVKALHGDDDENNCTVPTTTTTTERSSSSYRIVAGGMFGVSSWRDDEKKRGPRLSDETCQSDDSPVVDPKMQRQMTETPVGVADRILEETISMIPDEKFVVAVVCGEKEDTCSSLRVLAKNKAVAPLVILSCPEVASIDDADYQEGSLETMMNCERNLLSHLLSAPVLEGDHPRIRAVVFDPSVSYYFSRIAYKVFKAKRTRLFDLKNVYAIAVLLNSAEEQWKRNLMERFRKEIILYDPNFRAEVGFENDPSMMDDSTASMELGLTYSGDKGFVHNFKDSLLRIEQHSGLKSELRNIVGGLYVFEGENWTATYYSGMPVDPAAAALEQYMSQQPVAYQTVFQLEWGSSHWTVTSDGVRRALEAALPVGVGEVVEFHMEREVGDGCVVVALFSGGTCVALWDGRTHIDLNLLTNVESEELADELEQSFKANLNMGKPRLMKIKTILRDTQPRGYGRVVNFSSDLEQEQRVEGTIDDSDSGGESHRQRRKPRWIAKQQTTESVE